MIATYSSIVRESILKAPPFVGSPKKEADILNGLEGMKMVMFGRFTKKGEASFRPFSLFVFRSMRQPAKF